MTSGSPGQHASPQQGTPPPADGGLTVGQAAALVGTSVKTLHHWDDIQLASPSDRTWAGHRRYSATDVARLRRVLLYRETGLPLADIRRLLDGDGDGTAARDRLTRQRARLTEDIDRLRTMAHTTDQLISADITGLRLSPRQQTEILGPHWQPSRTPEAEDRWGGTEQWAQYLRRTAARDAAEWQRIVADTEQLNADLAAAFRAGVRPGSDSANALAERHRALLAQHFDCGHTLHVCIAEQYIEEPGYAAYYDSLAVGLTHWLRAVIRANAEARDAGSAPPTAPESATGQ